MPWYLTWADFFSYLTWEILYKKILKILYILAFILRNSNEYLFALSGTFITRDASTLQIDKSIIPFFLEAS